MKQAQALRKLISWISITALLMSLMASYLAVSVALPVAAATDYSSHYSTLADFTNTAPASYSNSNSTTVTEAISPSGYGAGLAWTRVDAATTYQNVVMNFSAASTATTAADTAIAFWLSMEDSGYDFGIKLRTFLRSRTSTTSGENCYRPTLGAPYYLVIDGVCQQRTVSDSQSLTLPGGFEGWIVLPYASCETHWGSNTSDTVSPDFISALDLYISNPYVTETVHIDEVGVTTNYMGFLEDVGDFPVVTADINALENTAAATVTGATLSSVTANAQSGNALQVAANAGGQIRIANQAANTAGLAKMNTLSLWVATGDTAVQLVPSLQLGDASAALAVSDLRRDFYRLVDGAEDESAAYPYQNGTVTIPANFSGYLVMDVASFAGEFDLSALTELVLTVPAAATLTLDAVQASTGPAAFIVKTLGKTMDTDLLQVQDATKVSLSGKTFTLLQDNMTSAQFGNAIAVRRGYRTIYRDVNNRQLFGAISDMDIVAAIYVYLGGELMAVYTNTELPLAQPGDTATGGGISLADYNVVVDFDNELYTSLAHDGGGGVTVANNISPYGEALKWERGTAAEGSTQSRFAMYFNPSGYADEQAMVFWVSASIHASSNFPTYFYGKTTDGTSGVMQMLAGAAYQTLSADGTVTDATAPATGYLRIEKDFEGWYIIPLSSMTGTNGLTAASGTVKGIYMTTGTTYGNIVYMDQFGFTRDTANFITKATEGTLNQSIPTLESSYRVGVDFDDTMYTAITPSGGGAQTVVSCHSPYGQALKWERGTSGSASIFEMSYAATGMQTDTALVFWVDGENLVANSMTMSIMLYDTGGTNGATRCFKISSGGEYQTLSVDGVLADGTAPSDQVISLAKGFVGWYIIPYSTFVEHWGGTDTDTVAAESVFRVRFATSSNYGNVIYLDEIGSAVSTNVFLATAMADLAEYTDDYHTWAAATCTAPETCTLCAVTRGDALGHTWAAATCTLPATCTVCNATDGEALGHTWVDATCTEAQYCAVCQVTEGEALGHNMVDGICSRCDLAVPLADLYNPVVDFDTNNYTNTSSPHSGRGGISEVYCVSPYGEALKWERGTAAEGSGATALTFNLTTTGDTTETALVFWMDGTDMLANAATNLLLYDTGGSRCFKMGNGNAYQTVSMDGVVSNEVSTSDQCITLKKDFVGWYIIPLTSFVPHWGSTTGSVAAGSVNSIYMAHGSNYGTVVYIDEIGFTSSIAAFRNVSAVEAVAWEGVQHTWAAATCTAPETCTLCAATQGVALGHTWAAATCTLPATCTVCNATDGEALGHTWVDATCTEAQYCSVCQEVEGEALGHNWVDGICSRCDLAVPLADLYTPVVDFDTNNYTNASSPHSGRGGISEVSCVSPYGEALKWERGTAAEGSGATALTFNLTTTGDTTETALVFWMDGTDMLANAATNLLLYDTGGSRCFKMGNGNAYQTVSVDGTVSNEVSTSDQCITLKKDFVGWYIIPLTSFVPHWGSTTGSVAAGSVNSIYMAHGSNYGTVVYIDEIGFASDIAAFRNVAAAETAVVQHDWNGTECTLCGATREE